MRIKHKPFSVTFGIVMIYLTLFYFNYKGFRKQDILLYVSLKHVVVHIDLKGSPPKLKYLASLLPMFKRLGVNGILMEYEDSFPYQGALASLRSEKPYNREELKHFLEQAAKMQIEVIPLIQTFGHMEHVLKLKQYRHLREVLKYSDSICPSDEESINLIKEMLQQVISFHESITPLKHLHIGCDEVYQLNKCYKCRSRHLTNRNLFIDHVQSVKTLVYNLNPSLTILMWDDHFRQNETKPWDRENLINLESMEPVYWDYSPGLKYASLATLGHYHETFKNIWIATAFKGANTQDATLPILRNRFQNHYNWFNFIVKCMFAGEKSVCNFKGVILTGWSRYNHFAPQCELLPASISSLVMNLLLIERFRSGISISDTLLTLDKDNNTLDIFFDKHIARKLEQELKCEQTVLNYESLHKVSDICKHKSSLLMNTLIQYKILMTKIDTNLKKIGGQNHTQSHAQFSWNCYKNLMDDITHWEKEIYFILVNYYDNYFIKEYVDQKLYSAKLKMKNIKRIMLRGKMKPQFRKIKRR